MKTIVAGCRTFDDQLLLDSELDTLPWTVSELVSGCCRGADQLGEAWANARGIPIKRFPADWAKYGASAGPRRNEQMADYASALVAFWDTKSRGTWNMIKTAGERGLKVKVIEVTE